MNEIFRSRTIRPSSRLEKSKSYKIDTKSVSKTDVLIVTIDHESKSFRRTFKFNGVDVGNKKSISFRVNDNGTSIDISWTGARPSEIIATDSELEIIAIPLKTTVDRIEKKQNPTDLKKSFEAISSSETSVLILGTMPGDKSLKLNEYYGHPRNRFWKILSTITNNAVPLTYSDKKTLLIKTKIGIWDVAHKGYRRGSLDSAIHEVEPNDLEDFILKHKNLKVMGFNGAKSELLFDKYFKRKKDIKYISLPSTSPANTGITFESICKQWEKILNSRE
jgi:hypoxanthine-DNA glycosylase